MTKNEIIKSIDDICEGLRRSTREANEALSKIRGAVGKVNDGENETGWELARRISYFSREELCARFGYSTLGLVLQFMSPDKIRECLDNCEKSVKHEIGFKRGDIVDIYTTDNQIFIKNAVYIGMRDTDHIIVINGDISTCRLPRDRYFVTISNEQEED